MADDNKRIGVFHLDGIPPAPRGRPQIEVTFDLDANGILNVSAKDLGTGKEQKITLTASSGLSKEEIERMRKDAELHATEDAKRREEVEARNQAENLCYQVEKMIADNADKIPAEKKAPVEKAVAELKEALKGSSLDQIKPQLDSLTHILDAFNAQFATLFTDSDRVIRRFREDIAPKVAADQAYQNALPTRPPPPASNTKGP
jgi:Molecular chaperone